MVDRCNTIRQARFIFIHQINGHFLYPGLVHTHKRNSAPQGALLLQLLLHCSQIPIHCCMLLLFMLQLQHHGSQLNLFLPQGFLDPVPTPQPPRLAWLAGHSCARSAFPPHPNIAPRLLGCCCCSCCCWFPLNCHGSSFTLAWSNFALEKGMPASLHCSTVCWEFGTI